MYNKNSAEGYVVPKQTRTIGPMLGCSQMLMDKRTDRQTTGKHQMNFLSLAVRSPGSSVVKHWPTDLTVPSLSPTEAEIFSSTNMVPLHTAFSLSLAHPPDMTYIQLKRM